MKQFLSKHRSGLMTGAKYLFSLLVTILAYTTNHNLFFAIVSGLEILLIALLTDWILKWNRPISYIFNVITLFLFNAQQLVMFFGGSYTTLVMITNLESLESLKGRFVPMILGVVTLLIFTFLPVSALKFKKVRTTSLLSLVLLAELSITFLYGNAYSPLFAVYRLGLDAKDYQEQLAAIKSQPNQTQFFYQAEIKSSRAKPANLPENPNVILIFTEGLSQNIIDDERNIMPNVKALQQSSLNFTNYYNHTFATYRGLIGQLYSGYQLDNYDDNTLVSMQDILVSYGYQTTFINTEPSNTQFISYLNNLGFQNLLTDTSLADGVNGSLTDKTAFETLFKTVEEEYQSGQPFFTAMYTYGTHMSFESADKKFGDGQYPILNRFYNFDYYFNEFIQQFNESPLADNTVLVFTSDHATFEDSDFKAAFPDYTRVNADLDKIPFFFYYKGVQAEQLDVQGRNSIDMAPTVLDYLDVSTPNYFLGQSLFFHKENNNSYDTVFYDNTYTLSTDGGVIAPLSEANQATIDGLLQKYFAAKTQMPQMPSQ